MSVTQKLMAAGSWSIALKPNVPFGVLNDIDITSRAFSLLVVTANAIDPTALGDYTPTTLRAIARYVGVYRTRPSKFVLSGAGLPVLLGDEEGKGAIIDTAITRSAGTLSNWMSDLFSGSPNGFSSGIVTNTGTSHSQTYQYVDRRSALNLICEAVGAEYRFNNDLTVDAAAASSLWTWTPAVLITRESDGTDPNIVGLTSVSMSAADDCEDYSSKVYLLARKDGGNSVGTATAASIPYYGPGGSTIRMERVVDGSSVDRSDATNVATQQLSRFSSLRRACTVSVKDPDITQKLRPGDRAYVFDLDTPGLYDTANQLVFRGRDVAPAILRVLGYTWPIQTGNGVYLITSESTPRIINLSDYVEYESGDVKLEIGAIDRPLFQSGVAAGDLSKASPTGDVPRYLVADAWTSTTPTYANFSLGNGTVDAGYFRIGRTVIYRGAITMGSTSSVTGIVQVSLPVAAKSSTWQTGSVDGEDNSASFARTSGTAEINPAIWGTGVAFTSTGNAGWNATTPFTWATGDILRWTITYEAAAS